MKGNDHIGGTPTFHGKQPMIMGFRKGNCEDHPLKINGWKCHLNQSSILLGSKCFCFQEKLMNDLCNMADVLTTPGAPPRTLEHHGLHPPGGRSDMMVI